MSTPRAGAGNSGSSSERSGTVTPVLGLTAQEEEDITPDVRRGVEQLWVDLEEESGTPIDSATRMHTLRRIAAQIRFNREAALAPPPPAVPNDSSLEPTGPDPPADAAEEEEEEDVEPEVREAADRILARLAAMGVRIDAGMRRIAVETARRNLEMFVGHLG